MWFEGLLTDMVALDNDLPQLSALCVGSGGQFIQSDVWIGNTLLR
jgi:hypothetical protein